MRSTVSYTYPIAGLKEDRVYQERVKAFIADMPACARDNFAYAFLEMLNNAIEHSGGTEAEITLTRDAAEASFTIRDNGVGVFTKVAEALRLEEKRYALLELAKGKFTSDPDSHSGEGIFFSSKCGGRFTLAADGLVFSSDQNSERLDAPEEAAGFLGTCVRFAIRVSHTQTLAALFEQYTDAPERYGFSKTSIPIRLLEYGDASPVFLSRSQARRLLARIEKFEKVTLDFAGVPAIGQGFADEVFRVFPAKHPHVTLSPVNCAAAVRHMIQHVGAEA